MDRDLAGDDFSRKHRAAAGAGKRRAACCLPVCPGRAKDQRGAFLPETLPGGDALGWQEREQYMAAEITSALERFSPERPVYIGGWWHLSCEGSVKTLRELLGIGAASCRLLDRSG